MAGAHHSLNWVVGGIAEKKKNGLHIHTGVWFDIILSELDMEVTILQSYLHDEIR